MKQIFAFVCKECLELYRTKKFFVSGILFLLFGIMNPAIAKLTPWVLELFADSLTDTGISFSGVAVNAVTSWIQYAKNMPILLIIFLVLFSSTLTTEYQKGTLINMVTKGLNRWKILFSKTFVILSLWTAGNLISFGVTYGYNAYFWDNGVVFHPVFVAFCFYLAGVWLISLMLFASSCLQTNSSVLLFTGAAFLVVYLVSLLPKISRYLPTCLLSLSNLLIQKTDLTEYLPAILITVLFIILNLGTAVFCFNRRKL